MAVRNGAAHLHESLQSISAQTFREFELIAVDDGSVDATGAILDAAAAHDSRLRVIHQTHCGFTESISRAIAASEGEWIARHDSDDVSMPHRFECQLKFLRGHPQVAAVGAGAIALDDLGRKIGTLPNPLGPAAVRDGLRTLKATPVHGSVVMRRSALDAVGGYRAAFLAAQDFDLWLRLSARYDIDNVPEILYYWRVHAGGVYATKRGTQLMYSGIALAFAQERAATGDDSYGLLETCGEDLQLFSRSYTLRGQLEALWGELLFRALDDPKIARGHLRSAILNGHYGARTLALYGWSLLGLHWPGGGQLEIPSVQS